MVDTNASPVPDENKQKSLFEYDIVSLDVLVPPVLNLACNNIRDVLDLSEYYQGCFNISKKERKRSKKEKKNKNK